MEICINSQIKKFVSVSNITLEYTNQHGSRLSLMMTPQFLSPEQAEKYNRDVKIGNKVLVLETIEPKQKISIESKDSN